MTKTEIILIFDIQNLNSKRIDDFDNILRERVYKCDREAFLKNKKISEQKGYYDVRIFPFCARSDDEKDLKKALMWISENSETLKQICNEFGTKLQLLVKFLVKNDLWLLDEDDAMELVFSSDDFKILKENNIDLNVTAVSSNCLEYDEYDAETSNNNIPIPYEYDCNELIDNTIKIPDEFNYIDGFLFCEGVELVEKLILHKNFIWINPKAFVDLKNLKYIDIDKENPELDGDGKTLFQKENIWQPAFFWCSQEKEGEYVMPKHIVEVAHTAFWNCKKLKSVTFINEEINFNPDHYSDVDIFKGCENITIKAPKDSTAYHYAKEHGMNFEEIS